MDNLKAIHSFGVEFIAKQLGRADKMAGKGTDKVIPIHNPLIEWDIICILINVVVDFFLSDWLGFVTNKFRTLFLKMITTTNL